MNGGNLWDPEGRQLRLFQTLLRESAEYIDVHQAYHIVEDAPEMLFIWEYIGLVWECRPSRFHCLKKTTV